MIASSACFDIVNFAIFQGALIGFVSAMALFGVFYIRKKL